ncbi:MAG: nucleoside-diphosphate kinase [Gammaproteobacteria bacterium]|nr:nucleoside-diphosphate kinase [Gammaproteobacteria bacterium]HJL95546.1 nucleoside-diphosphate kinase [SAR86 cluster bacterium]|tara:strand:- start:17476 stop:17883 length:408 start_codon:yes stop_codon:yes gene_type:complete
MALEKTLSIIKPDAVSKGHSKKICERLESEGLNIVSKKLIQLSDKEAKGFYIEHDGKPFFADLIKFMTSGPIQVQVLEGEDAISRYREVMGNTNPKEAKPGTLRADFADSIDANAVHGSDSQESAEREISYFFSK